MYGLVFITLITKYMITAVELFANFMFHPNNWYTPSDMGLNLAEIREPQGNLILRTVISTNFWYMTIVKPLNIGVEIEERNFIRSKNLFVPSIKRRNGQLHKTFGKARNQCLSEWIAQIMQISANSGFGYKMK